MLRFDLSSIPQGATIAESRAYVWIRKDNSSSQINVYRITEPWD